MQHKAGQAAIECVRGDITQQPDMDAVVNAANAELRPGGGVAGVVEFFLLGSSQPGGMKPTFQLVGLVSLVALPVGAIILLGGGALAGVGLFVE